MKPAHVPKLLQSATIAKNDVSIFRPSSTTTHHPLSLMQNATTAEYYAGKEDRAHGLVSLNIIIMLHFFAGSRKHGGGSK